MIERKTDQRTLVGVPFYDGEGIEVLKACLSNLDRCLNRLGMDAKIVVGINGPRVSLGKLPLSYEIDRSEYNADIKFIKTRPGLVAAEKEICSRAEIEGYQRIFLTDADISRLPQALYYLWHQGDRPVVGANYAAYPVEILIEAGVRVTPQENALINIFEADKHPLAREFTSQFRPQRRLKGSLLLVDTNIAQSMFGNQNITSDSRMNSLIPSANRQLVNNGAFMHYARTSLTDYIQARLRHFRAAATEGDLDPFAKKSIMYKPLAAELIAQKIVRKYPYATEVASNFLLQCALRVHVTTICCNIVSGRRTQYERNLTSSGADLTSKVDNFKQAYARIADLLGQVDWDSLDSPVTNGKGVTQNNQPRAPIDLEPFLASEKHRRIILNYLGLDENAEV